MVILLKSLEDHLFKASISEDMLEILEVLEKHLLDGSNSITTTMKSAYCRVAVECTLKYLEAKASHPTYLQAVDRIWRGRILAIASHVSHLFSDDLKNWKTEIENSLLVINKFVSLPDIRMEALHKVQMFFDEAWDNFCASFLHPAAQIVTDSQQRRRGSFFSSTCILLLLLFLVVVFFDTLM
jgi:telomeric repeat-binding factor 2